MSPWRWTVDRLGKSIFFGLILFSISHSAGLAAPTSAGPTSKAESELLWQDGRAAFDAGQDEEAVRLLQRLVDRYPAMPGSIQAQSFLGISYLRLDRPLEAIGPLKAYLLAVGSTSAEGLHTRYYLGQAYLRLNRFDQARLTSEEMRAMISKSPGSPPSQDSKRLTELPDRDLWEFRAQLLKVQAQLGMQQDKGADWTLASLTKSKVLQKNADLRADFQEVQLQAKLRECMKTPKGNLDEGQLRAILQRRGFCLQESTLIAKELLLAGDSARAARSTERLQEAFTAYGATCQNPPAPAHLRKSPHKLQTYRQELAAVLRPDFDENRRKVLDLLDDLLNSLKTKDPKLKVSTAQAAIETLSQSLRKL